MPYQPINPVPHNIGIENNMLNYVFSFSVDKYDKVNQVEINLFDLYNNNLQVYTIVRSFKDGQQYIKMYDNVQGIDLIPERVMEASELDGETNSLLPLIGGKNDSDEFRLDINSLSFTKKPTTLFGDNKKYTWVVKLTGEKYDVWITENNTYADKDSSLPYIYVPNNTRMEKGQQIVLGGDTKYLIDEIDSFNTEGKIYYRQSKGKSVNTLSYFSVLNGYISYKGNGGNVTTVTVDNEILPYLQVNTKFTIIDDATTSNKEYTIKTITNNTLVIDPAITGTTMNQEYENLIGIVTNTDGTQGALITSGVIPSEWIYVLQPNTVFYCNNTKQTITEINTTDFTVTFSPGFISNKDGDQTININLAKANNILPSDLTDYEVLIVGNQAMIDKFTGANVDLTDLYITLNYINYFKIEKVEQYPNNTMTDYSTYGLATGERLFKITASEIISPTKYQVNDRGLEKSYTLERQSSILKVKNSDDTFPTGTIEANKSFIIYSNYIISPYYCFSVLPQANINYRLEDGTTGTIFNINSTRIKIFAEYDGNVAYYTWKLKELASNSIKDNTTEQFTSYIEYEYERLNNGTYSLELVITTDEGCIIQSTVTLNVSYEQLNNPFDVIAEADCRNKAIKINFSDFKQIKGYVYKKINGNYEYQGTNEDEIAQEGFEITKEENYSYCYIKPDYQIKWDRILPLEKEEYIDINSDFTLVSRFKLGSDFNGKILVFKDDNGTYYTLSAELKEQDSKMGLSFKFVIGTNEVEQYTSLYNKNQLELQSQMDSLKDNNTYYYFDFNNNTTYTFNDNTYFFVENDLLEQTWYTMIMKKDENSKMGISLYKGNITSSSTPICTLKLDSINIHYNTLIAYENIYWNYIQIFDKEITDEKINELILKNAYTPSWDENTYMLINFDSQFNIDSIPIDASSIQGVLYKFIILRSQINDDGIISEPEKIAEIKPTRKYFYDYGIEKKRKYIYTVIPYFKQEDKDNIYVGGSAKSNKAGVFLNYDYVSLYSGINLYNNDNYSVDGTLKQKENTYLLDNTEQPWYFKYNLESGDVTINTDSNVFEGLFPYAKIGKGPKNYRTGSITALIGRFKEEPIYRADGTIDYTNVLETEYYNTIQMANDFQDFCNTNTVKILRDDMGNVIPVYVNLKSIKYDSQKMPSTITVTFEWTQVAEYKTLVLFDVTDEEKEVK